MGTIFQKLNYLDGTKGLIRQAINDKGGTLTENNTFRSYADAIAGLPSGGFSFTWDFTQGLTDQDGNHALNMSQVDNHYIQDSTGLHYTEYNRGAILNAYPLSLIDTEIILKCQLTACYNSQRTILKFFGSGQNDGINYVRFQVDSTNMIAVRYTSGNTNENIIQVGQPSADAPLNVDIKIVTKTDFTCDIYLNMSGTYTLIASNVQMFSTQNPQTYTQLLLGSGFLENPWCGTNELIYKSITVKTKD